MHHSDHSKKTADSLIHWLRNYSSTHLDSYLADKQGAFPPHVFMDLGNQGFFGMHISREHGGLELKLVDMLRVIEQFAAIDLTLTTIIIETIQGAHTLENYASAPMKKQYLNKLAKGQMFMAGAMTESAAGSNPRAMKSIASPHQNDKWLLRGSKRWVGMAASAELIAIYVQQIDANNNWVGMSGFLVSRGTEGLHIGAAAPTMGLRGFSKHTIYLDDIEVSAENLLGQPGQGMEIAQDNMMFIRLCLAAASIGAMKRCVQLMHRYAERRSIVTGFLIDNPVTLVRLSEITAVIEALENFISTIAGAYDSNIALVPEEAFIVSKILGSEFLGKVADLLVQTLGARGYEEGNGASQLFRDARVFRIFEGPTEALNMYLGSRMQGKNLDLERFFANFLDQKSLFKDLERVVEKINDSEHKRFGKSFTGQYWSQALVGEVITYGLLLAITDYCCLRNNSEKLHRALLWARNKYNEAVDKSQKLSLGEKVLVQRSELHDIVINYTAQIGNVEQTKNREGITIDSLLKKQDNIFPEQQGFSLYEMLQTEAHQNFELTEAGFRKTLEISKVIRKETIPCLYAHQLFEQQALLNADAVALSYQGKEITYAQLNAKANRVAHFLIKEGIAANKIVAIYIERSIEMIVGLLGILKAGGAYLPLDCNYPIKSLQFMFEDSKSDCILSHKKLAKDLPFNAKKTFFIEDIIDSASQELNDENPQIEINLDNLGYLIYTSGSTGKPKGVMLPHKALTNLIHWQHRKIPEKRNVLQFTALSFDMSFLEIFSALISGGTLVLISEHDRMDPWQFSTIVKNHQIQQLVLPVPFLKTLASASVEKNYFSFLKEIIIAGEQLIVSPAILSFFTQLPSCRLLNYYGPSETHVVTSYTFPEKVAEWPDYPPIGTPIFNTKIIILNNKMQPVPPGETGEIYIGGVSLAKGYINRNELTQERFIDDIWSKTNLRLYKTGDLGKSLPDGNLVFLGRKDAQLKIRGFRIEPKEIEAHLIKYPGIKEAVVIAKKDAASEKHLEAFIVVESEKDDKLINLIYLFLQERVPPQMVPSVFNIIEKMPLTDSGKIDRKRLEHYNKPVSYSVNKIEKPHTSTEKEIIEIMEAIFNLPIGVNNSFASIGGNSLLAMHIISKLRDKFAIELPACTILSDPRIADTAKRIDLLLLEKATALSMVDEAN
ncbi:amino acid adenylation domain-containing protein [Legionella drozanskii]|uniref:Peptide synthetase, non-ribosomal n=1 Tax=Legionella drozanskii LLAP-1 TaxID=1212489 RepID=A0A0W0SY07_9GAMM|nr:amino acid adenylation domain-containing protein [Legionella drozanskii]KTC88239.1 peptide synthetase, non-ribosomal [Legionella drozanskii LLAP-1]